MTWLRIASTSPGFAYLFLQQCVLVIDFINSLVDLRCFFHILPILQPHVEALLPTYVAEAIAIIGNFMASVRGHSLAARAIERISYIRDFGAGTVSRIFRHRDLLRDVGACRVLGIDVTGRIFRTELLDFRQILVDFAA